MGFRRGREPPSGGAEHSRGPGPWCRQDRKPRAMSAVTTLRSRDAIADVEVTSRLQPEVVGKSTGPGTARPAQSTHFRGVGIARPAVRATSRAILSRRTQRRDCIGARRSYPFGLGDTGAARAAVDWKNGARCHSRIRSIRADRALFRRVYQPASDLWLRADTKIL